MNARHCCESETRGRGNARRALLRRNSEFADWIVPSATLALLPKCPACLAAYIALATGVGVSVATASYLHFSLIFLSVMVLFVLAAKRIQGLIGL